jgi:hypothetical protein
MSRIIIGAPQTSVFSAWFQASIWLITFPAIIARAGRRHSEIRKRGFSAHAARINGAPRERDGGESARAEH